MLDQVEWIKEGSALDVGNEDCHYLAKYNFEIQQFPFQFKKPRPKSISQIMSAKEMRDYYVEIKCMLGTLKRDPIFLIC